MRRMAISTKSTQGRDRKAVGAKPKSRTQTQDAGPVPEAFAQGVLDRIIEILDQSSVPAHGRATFLANLTGKNRQTATSWLRRRNLPDLQSFVALAIAFDFDMYYVLGITQAARKRLPGGWAFATPMQPTGSASDLLGGATPGSLSVRELGLLPERMNGAALELRPMVGDSMAPEIQHNEVIGIDTSEKSFRGDGIYALEKDAALFVRRVEVHIEGGYTLSPRNDHYGAVRVENLDDPAFREMKVLGRVLCVVKPVT